MMKPEVTSHTGSIINNGTMPIPEVDVELPDAKSEVGRLLYIELGLIFLALFLGAILLYWETLKKPKAEQNENEKERKLIQKYVRNELKTCQSSNQSGDQFTKNNHFTEI